MATRAEQAGAVIGSVLTVASALALNHGQFFDSIAERRRPLVVLLGEGSWANRVSVLAALRYTLEKVAPNTAARMKERQAFREQEDWRTLWKKFGELGDIPKPTAQAAPKPRYRVLGAEWNEEEFSASAAQGPEGELVRRLQEYVDPCLDLSALRQLSSERPVGRRRNTGATHKGSPGIHKQALEGYLKMIGTFGGALCSATDESVISRF